MLLMVAMLVLGGAVVADKSKFVVRDGNLVVSSQPISAEQRKRTGPLLFILFLRFLYPCWPRLQAFATYTHCVYILPYRPTALHVTITR